MVALDQLVLNRIKQMKQDIIDNGNIMEAIDNCVIDFKADGVQLTYNQRGEFVAHILTGSHKRYKLRGWTEDLLKELNSRINDEEYSKYTKDIYNDVRNCIIGFVTMGLLTDAYRAN